MDAFGWRWMMFQWLSLSYLLLSYHPLMNFVQEKEQQSVPEHLDVILILDNSCVAGYYYCFRYFTHTLCSELVPPQACV